MDLHYVSIEDDDDCHFCMKCRATIAGLDNYVQHRKSRCNVRIDDTSLSAYPKGSRVPSSPPRDYLSLPPGLQSEKSECHLIVDDFLPDPPEIQAEPEESVAKGEDLLTRSPEVSLRNPKSSTSKDDFLSRTSEQQEDRTPNLCSYDFLSEPADLSEERDCNLRADDFFSLLELQSSTKTVPKRTAISGVVTRSKSRHSVPFSLTRSKSKKIGKTSKSKAVKLPLSKKCFAPPSEGEEEGSEGVRPPSTHTGGKWKPGTFPSAVWSTPIILDESESQLRQPLANSSVTLKEPEPWIKTLIPIRRKAQTGLSSVDPQSSGKWRHRPYSGKFWKPRTPPSPPSPRSPSSPRHANHSSHESGLSEGSTRTSERWGKGGTKVPPPSFTGGKWKPGIVSSHRKFESIANESCDVETSNKDTKTADNLESHQETVTMFGKELDQSSTDEMEEFRNCLNSVEPISCNEQIDLNHSVLALCQEKSAFNNLQVNTKSHLQMKSISKKVESRVQTKLDESKQVFIQGDVKEMQNNIFPLEEEEEFGKGFCPPRSHTSGKWKPESPHSSCPSSAANVSVAFRDEENKSAVIVEDVVLSKSSSPGMHQNNPASCEVPRDHRNSGPLSHKKSSPSTSELIMTADMIEVGAETEVVQFKGPVTEKYIQMEDVKTESQVSINTQSESCSSVCKSKQCVANNGWFNVTSGMARTISEHLIQPNGEIEECAIGSKPIEKAKRDAERNSTAPCTLQDKYQMYENSEAGISNEESSGEHSTSVGVELREVTDTSEIQESVEVKWLRKCVETVEHDVAVHFAEVHRSLQHDMPTNVEDISVQTGTEFLSSSVFLHADMGTELMPIVECAETSVGENSSADLVQESVAMEMGDTHTVEDSMQPETLPGLSNFGDDVEMELEQSVLTSMVGRSLVTDLHQTIPYLSRFRSPSAGSITSQRGSESSSASDSRRLLPRTSHTETSFNHPSGSVHHVHLSSEMRVPHTGGKWAPGKADEVRALLGLGPSSRCETFARKSGSTVQYWCGPCNRRLSSRAMYERHLDTILHISRTLAEDQLDACSSEDHVLELAEARLTRRRRAACRRARRKREEESRVRKARLVDQKRCSVCRARVLPHQIGKHLVSHYHWRNVRAQQMRLGDLPPSAKKMVLDNIWAVVRECPFQCGMCKFYCNTSAEFLNHWDSSQHRQRDKQTKGYYWCSPCEEGASTSTAMYTHLRSSGHLEVEAAVNRSVAIVVSRRIHLRCYKPGCLRTFRFNAQLMAHERRFKHQVDASTAGDHWQGRQRCPVCGVPRRNRLALQKHIFRTHPELDVMGQFFCGVCSVNFRTAEEVKQHRQSLEHRDTLTDMHNYRERRCPYCRVLFSGISSLRLHIRQRHPNNKHSCHVCGKSCIFPQELAYHTRTGHCNIDDGKHTPETSLFECDTCEFTTLVAEDGFVHQVLEHGSTVKQLNHLIVGGGDSTIEDARDCSETNNAAGKVESYNGPPPIESEDKNCRFTSAKDNEIAEDVDREDEVQVQMNHTVSPKVPRGEKRVQTQTEEVVRSMKSQAALWPPRRVESFVALHHDLVAPKSISQGEDKELVLESVTRQAAMEIGNFQDSAQSAELESSDLSHGQTLRDDALYQCPDCLFETENNVSWSLHRRSHEVGKGELTETNNDCVTGKRNERVKKDSARQKGELDRRSRKVASGTGGRNIAAANRKVAPENRKMTSETTKTQVCSEESALFKCSECPFESRHYGSLKRHIKSHSTDREKKEMCEECGKRFLDKWTLEQHKQTHRGKAVGCPEPGCIYRARTQAELKEHLTSHSDERNYPCEHCQFRAKNQRLLNRHVKRRHNEFPAAHKCPHCSFETLIPAHIKRHMRVHTGAKPYACPYCSFACNILENLRKHILKSGKHPGKHVYSCKLCPASAPFGANTMQDFRAHLELTHAKPLRSSAEAATFAMGMYNPDADVDMNATRISDTRPKRSRAKKRKVLHKSSVEDLGEAPVNLNMAAHLPVSGDFVHDSMDQESGDPGVFSLVMEQSDEEVLYIQMDDQHLLQVGAIALGGH